MQVQIQIRGLPGSAKLRSLAAHKLDVAIAVRNLTACMLYHTNRHVLLVP